MKNNCAISIIYPAGNTTALVEGFENKKQYMEYANQFLSGNISRQYVVEQVGFVETPILPTADCRLQMAGGELCLNATRALAALLANRYSNDVRTSFQLEASGYANSSAKPILIPADVTRISRDMYDVSLELDVETLLVNKKPIERKMNFSNKTVKVQQIALSGIDHLFIPLSKLPKSVQEIFSLRNSGLSSLELPELKEIFKQIYIDVPGLAKSDAVGLVAYEKTDNTRFEIYPLVMVNKQETIYYETACGSATVALAFLRYLESESKITLLRVEQPSGYKLTTSIFNNKEKLLIKFSGQTQVKGLGTLLK